MSLVHRILVPVDFSQGAREALDFAMRLGAALDASIEVLHVVPSAEAALAKEANAREEASKNLAAFMAETKPPPGARVAKQVLVGDPSKAIVDACADFDVVVMGRHGHTGLMHMLMGSVTERVLRHAPCPVLTVRTKDVPVNPLIVAATKTAQT